MTTLQPRYSRCSEPVRMRFIYPHLLSWQHCSPGIADVQNQLHTSTHICCHDNTAAQVQQVFRTSYTHLPTSVVMTTLLPRYSRCSEPATHIYPHLLSWQHCSPGTAGVQNQLHTSTHICCHDNTAAQVQQVFRTSYTHLPTSVVMTTLQPRYSRCSEPARMRCIYPHLLSWQHCSPGTAGVQNQPEWDASTHICCHDNTAAHVQQVFRTSKTHLPKSVVKTTLQPRYSRCSRLQKTYRPAYPKILLSVLQGAYPMSKLLYFLPDFLVFFVNAPQIKTTTTKKNSVKGQFVYHSSCMNSVWTHIFNYTDALQIRHTMTLGRLNLFTQICQSHSWSKTTEHFLQTMHRVCCFCWCRRIISWTVIVWSEFVSLVSCILPPLCRFPAANYHLQLQIQTRHIWRWLTSMKLWMQNRCSLVSKLFDQSGPAVCFSPKNGLKDANAKER